MPDQRTKIDLYRRLARIASEADLADFAGELVDRFGPLPEVVDRLISLSELRIWAHRYGIDSIHLEDRFAVFGYTSASQIQSLARQSGGQLRVVDGKSAYLTLSKEVLKTGKAHKPIRSLLRPQ